MWAKYASERHCSWGIFQNYICDDYGWSIATAKYVYETLVFNKKERSEYVRYKKNYGYLLDGDWQVDELLRRYESRIKRVNSLGCKEYTTQGQTIHRDLYCAIRLHNWNGGNAYVNRVINKKIYIYGRD